MPSISNGAATHHFISLGGGQPQGFGLRLGEITRPGVDGHAYREESLKGVPYALDGHVDVDTLAALKTTLDALVTAYQGKVVTVLDDYGSTHANVVCQLVERVVAHPLLLAVGGLSNNKGAYLCVRFTLVRTA